jgi:hypothetical protein
VPSLTIQKASLLALTTFLAARPALTGVGAKVVSWFPTDDELDSNTVSVAMAGARQRIWSNPRVVSQAVVDATTIAYTWRMMAIAQPIQLDVWVTDYPSKRDELLAILETELARGVGTTLGASYQNRDPFRDGLLLALDPTNGHTGWVDCVFEDPQLNDTDDAARRGEWRATIRGELRTSLEITANSPRILQMILAMKIGEVPLGTAPEITYTFDANS